MRLDSYYNILKEMKKRPGLFLRSKDIYLLEAYEMGYFIGYRNPMINYASEEIKEQITNVFFFKLINDYCLLFLSKICNNNKIDEIYQMSINNFMFVERLVDKEKQFDTIIDINISLYELILPLIDIENENISNKFFNTDAESIVIDGKIINNIKQLNDFIESLKDDCHYFVRSPINEEPTCNIFSIFNCICFYNNRKENGVNLIIKNEKEFLRENLKDKKVFYSLINTNKNILNNISLFIHPKFNSNFDRIDINLIIES